MGVAVIFHSVKGWKLGESQQTLAFSGICFFDRHADHIKSKKKSTEFGGGRSGQTYRAGISLRSCTEVKANDLSFALGAKECKT